MFNPRVKTGKVMSHMFQRQRSGVFDMMLMLVRVFHSVEEMLSIIKDNNTQIHLFGSFHWNI